jgi:hypothetical protein
MRKLLYLSILAIVALFSSCDKESEDISRSTTYAVITFDGDDVVFVEKGGSYTAAATSSGGEDVKISGVDGVDVNSPGFYTVTFAATNADGYDALVSQLVIVWEADDVLAGVYDGIRVGKDNGGIVLVYPNGDGTYTCTDLLGGYYDQGVNYGPAYASVTSKMEISGDVITADNGSAVFGGPIGISEGAKTGDVLAWKATIIGGANDGFGFNVELTKRSMNN